ncbi:MAG: T9SS type A sorting domain-containing protein [Ignavibacteria bacterium]|nr:T9SS type A sorting domain-containing protein [Ignavibacteria bacterium]
MKRSRRVRLIFLWLPLFLLKMNVTAISQTVQWQTIFGNPGSQYADIGYNCIQSIDGTFLVTGRWEIPVPEWPYTRVKAFVSRLDTSGSVMWTKLIGDSSVDNEAFTLAEDPSGNIYVPYWSGYAHLVKLNADGQLLWDADYTSNNILLFRGISFQDNNRNVALLGLSYGTQFDWTTSVTKLDSSGRLIWTRSIFDSIPAIRTYECYNNSYSFSESGYYVCGNQGTSPYILKLDTSGKVIWNNKYLNSKAIKSIGKISDLSLMASCALLPGLRLMKIDSSGNQYWTRSYSSDSLAGFIYSDKILHIPSHRFAFGVTRGNYFGRLMITDTSGNILTSKFYNFSKTYTVNQENINFCSDSGFVISGSIRNWDSFNEQSVIQPSPFLKDIEGDKNIDIMIYKTTKTGNTTIINSQSLVSVHNITVHTYPNPTNGSFRVRYSSSFIASVEIKLFDIAGRTVYSKSLKLASGKNEIDINADKLVSGTYFLKTNFGKNSLINKILILK